MKQVEVVAAVIKFGDRYLCTQREASKYDYISYKFEFPGGKIEEGESEKQALARELSEELEMKVDILDKFMTVNHTYPDFHLKMNVYLCNALSEDFKLNVHKSFIWATKEQFDSLDWAAADVDIVSKIISEL